MNKKITMGSLALVLMIVAALGAGCASSTVSTVTITQVQTRTQNQTATVPTTIIKTITQVVAGTTQDLVVTLTGVPPLIPHPIDVVQGSYGTCFQCHPIPVGHQGRLANETVCTQCHLLGPLDPNLIAK
jgi:nitrate reductase cytochrome c-type subunit